MDNDFGGFGSYATTDTLAARVRDFVWRHKVGLAVLTVIILVLAFWSRYGFLTVNVSGNQGNGELTYTLLHQTDSNTTTITTSSTSIRRLVPRGKYEVFVSQNDNHSFSVTASKGFLRGTTVSATLKPERSREFVGHNPDPCMHYRQVLVSFTCGASSDTIALHVPASGKTPTYTRKNPLAVDGTIEGIIETNQGTVALMQLPLDEQYTEHALFMLNDAYVPVKKRDLPGLKGDSLYAIRAYQNGFVVYGRPYSEVYYFESFDANPQTVNINRPEDNSLEPVGLKVSSDGAIGVLFSNHQSDSDETARGAIRNHLLIVNKQGSRSMTLNGNEFSQFTFCGKASLCLINGGWLEVYKLGEKKLDLSFRVSGVKSLVGLGTEVLAVRDNIVLRINVDEQSMSVDYSLGDYIYCGAETTSSNRYLLCVFNKRRKSSALLVDTAQANADSLDKKVSRLLDLEEVKDVSVYKQSIFISPELGEVVFNPDTGFFDYDPQVEARVAGTIQQKIAEIGFDRNKYTIHNTFE